MKKYSSPIYGVIDEPENFEELMQCLLKDVRPDGYARVRYWRGQSDLDWPIHSAGYRRLQNSPFYSNKLEDRIFKDYELRLLEHATHKGYRYYNGIELNDFELLARLQHHGAATRLVDFSKSALVALYFCVVENPMLPGLLIGIHTDYIYGHEGVLVHGRYEDIIKECQATGPSTWEPTGVSNRIAAQHSQFLYSSISNSKMGSLVLPTEDGSCLFLAISPALKAKTSNVLQSLFDLRKITLFPDIDGFSIANSAICDVSAMDRW